MPASENQVAAGVCAPYVLHEAGLSLVLPCMYIYISKFLCILFCVWVLFGILFNLYKNIIIVASREVDNCLVKVKL
jgi:hypothetical protein